MRDPRKPDTQADQYLADLPYAHKSQSDDTEKEGINPREPASMPRGEDDAETLADSPEYHDRTDSPGAGTKTPPDR